MTEARIDVVLRRLVGEVVDDVARKAIEPLVIEHLHRFSNRGPIDIALERGDFFLRPSEAAKIADCHPKTIMRLAREGHLKIYRVGKDIRIRFGDLIAYLEGRCDDDPDEEIRQRARETALRVGSGHRNVP